ncbi:MAG: hypothetical protein QOI15_2754, partial [Pseudonocardiales bacterium]|nr:hypothetical protein [Pseudonocardiales bacterium]
MSTDLHNELRAALHDGDITAADLRHPEPRAARRRLPGF